MKGYELIFLANGALFLALGGMALANGVYIESKGHACESGNQTACDVDITVGSSTKRATPFLLVGGVALTGLALTLIVHRRRTQPSPPPDEDPPEAAEPREGSPGP